MPFSLDFALFCLMFLWVLFMLTLYAINSTSLKIWPYLGSVLNSEMETIVWLYASPLKETHHYWVGALLLTCGFILIVSVATSEVYPRLYLFKITVIMVVFSSHSDVYQRWYLSILKKSYFSSTWCTWPVGCCILSYWHSEDVVIKCAILFISGSTTFLQFILFLFVHAIYYFRRWRKNQIVAVNNHEDDYQEPLMEDYSDWVKCTLILI